MSPSPAKKVVLIVDDEAELREVIASDLVRNGYEIAQACSGHEAFEIIEGKHIDVVVSDVRMPGGGGVELLERIKLRDPQSPAVIIITGYSEVSTAELLKKGAAQVFEKPFDRKKILNAIDRLCGKSS